MNFEEILRAGNAWWRLEAKVRDLKQHSWFRKYLMKRHRRFWSEGAHNESQSDSMRNRRGYKWKPGNIAIGDGLSPKRRPTIKISRPLFKKFPWTKKIPDAFASRILYLKPGSDLLSHGETPHYHRRWVVSLLSSGWDQVVPTLHCRQANWFEEQALHFHVTLVKQQHERIWKRMSNHISEYIVLGNQIV